MKQSPDLENFLKTSIQKNVKPNHLALATAYFIWLANLWLTDTAVTPNWLVYTYCRYC